MWKPKVLESDELQSANFVEESSPGAGDGQGWRLSKNGDFQLGKISQVDGVMYTEHTTIRVDRDYDPDVHMRIDAETLRQASIKPANIAPTSIEIRMTVGDSGGALLEMNEEQRAYLHEKIRRLVTDEVGTERYRITEEVSARAEADTALASHIGAMNSGLAHVLAGVGASIGVDVGKEYLYVKQPGGEVRIGDLSDKLASMGRLGGKPLTAEDFHLKPGNIAGEFAGGLLREPTREFLAENVRSDLTPQAACALSLMTPITSNGKAPANILPRGVDDKE